MKSTTGVVSAPTVERLLGYVHEALCRRENLDPVQTSLRHSVIRRRGRACGLFLHVEGPRLLRGYAVWAGEEYRLLFYNSAGERTGEVRLSEAPDPAAWAA